MSNRILGALVIGLVGCSSAWADDPLEVSLFPAIEQGQIEVELIAHDFSRLTMKVKNKTRQPLEIELPRVFAAAPARATESPGEPAPQSLGGSFGEELAKADSPGALKTLSIGPGRVVREKLDCFCLEFGKPNPHPKVPYELTPLEHVNDSPAIRELLEVYGRGKLDQRATQLAAWHVANGVEWDALARMRFVRPGSRSASGYRRREIEEAVKIVGQLQSKAGSLSGGDH